MKNERKIRFLHNIFPILGTGLLVLLASPCAFHPKIRKQIKENANGVCQTCQKNVGKHNLIASHKIHGTQSKKDGIAQCKKCEAETHIKHVHSPQRIGLRREDNNSVAWGHFCSLEEKDRQDLQNLYPTEIAYLENKFT